MQAPHPSDGVLVTLLKEPQDWDIITAEGWYRMRKNAAQDAVIAGEIKWLALYRSAKFDLFPRSVVHLVKVLETVEASRQELFPEEATGSADERHYIKFTLGHTYTLPQALILEKNHRFWLHVTSWAELSSISKLDELFIKDTDHETEANDYL